ncbi:bifunctional diaminohydroxyphosphoribosylaminopyrimidine deaminase/5-amino-6-(5-phosphoribosylamino)uracil reductase RibD [Bacillota bacterium LX-D]|nr:bifunctional diaminohydroxyphosphoribosylaminopyrimidine deaminase/5-amino-6-(5-phosphoribosylamino)uracil reductase RibD [Bacillota bacterium LX-D]
MNHHLFMQRALALAVKAKGRTSPNPMVGAVVVKDGKIVGEGYHHQAGAPHAEVLALQEAGTKAQGSTLYVTLEPCCHFGKTPPCVEKIIQSGVREVIGAVADPNTLVNGQGYELLKAAGIKVQVGVLRQEAEQLNEVFFKYIRTKKPFVTLKWAMTLDGKIATVNNDSKWVSNEKSRALVHQWRDSTDALVVGVNTILNDNPFLTTRLPHGRGKDPWRIILDTHLRTPVEANVLNTASKAPTIICCGPEADEIKKNNLAAQGVQIWELPIQGGTLDLNYLLESLGKQELTSILVEGGGKVLESFFRLGLADKVCCFIAPKILGGEAAKTPVEGEGIKLMSQAYKLTRVSHESIGEDLLITGYLRR